MDWLTCLYQKAFPTLYEIKENTSVLTQKGGVDKYFYVKSGSPIKIEEKVRGRDYGDLLLEDYSNWEKRTPGWARDLNKRTDYLAYIITPSLTLWIIHYPALRRYFLGDYNALFDKYVKQSKSRDYVWGETFDYDGVFLYRTANIPVPLREFPKNWLATYFWEYKT